MVSWFVIMIIKLLPDYISFNNIDVLKMIWGFPKHFQQNGTGCHQQWTKILYKSLL